LIAMNKGKDFWAPRKHGFDDDGPMAYEARQRPARPHDRSEGPVDDAFASGGSAAPTTMPTVDAVVKWYKDEKGFGFVELSNGQGDAFLHATALHAAGHDTVLPGAKMRVIVAAGAKGPQVSRIVSVDSSGVVEQRPRRVLEGGIADARRAAAHQHDRFVPAVLKEAQQHDRHQAADMQTVGGAVVSDIGDDRAGAQAFAERLEVGALVNKAAFARGLKKVWARCGHGCFI